MAKVIHGNKRQQLPAEEEKLLFSLAYPANRQEYEHANEVLTVKPRSVRAKFPFGHPSKKIAGNGTSITGSFSFDIAKWLAENFPVHAEIESSSADAESIRLFFRAILPRTEFENMSAGELSLIKRIKLLKGKSPGSLLSWLIRHLDALVLPTRIKETLFHNLQLYIRWELNPDVYKKLLLPAAAIVPFLHRNLLRKPVLQRVISKKLPLSTPITESKRIQLIATARATLALLYRETEPFTYADVHEITEFELERGLSVVLFGMDPERRLSIESYIGYLAFKNGIPVAYGGGWIFGSRCQFGINILPPFRGGESALLFYQLLRVYRQYFNATRFVVKPYQFGKNNKEAMRSGAFWFYYKAGFRPVDDTLLKLAAREWKKKKTVNNYRTPLPLLKRFTGSNMILDISEKPNPKIDASMISREISAFINQHYSGIREKAIAGCSRKTKKQLGLGSFAGWDMHERNAFVEWSLLIHSLLKISEWNSAERKKLLQIIKTKGSSPERDFIIQLQKHDRFWKDLTASIQ